MKYSRWLTAIMFLVLMGLQDAHAQYSCSVNTTALASGNNYDPFAVGANDTVGAFSINNCTRPRGNTNRFPAIFWLGANNGLNMSGTRRMRRGTSSDYITYSLFRDNACSVAWGNTDTTGYTFANSETKNNDTVTGPDPLASTALFCLRIDAGQSTAVPSSLLTVPPGNYTDTVTVTLRSTNSGGFTWDTTTLQLSTRIDPTCQFSTPPAPIALDYTSFSPVAVSGSSNFQMRCTNTTTYSLAVTPNTGSTLLGLNYDVSLSGAGGAGTGAPQAFSATANIPANQSGTCAVPPCTAAQNHTVTVTY